MIRPATTPATREDGASGADGEREVQYEVWQDGMMVASSTDPDDARHYLAVYGQDGPVAACTAVTWRYDGFDAALRPSIPSDQSDRERVLEEALRAIVGQHDKFIQRHGNQEDAYNLIASRWELFDAARQALARKQEGEA